MTLRNVPSIGVALIVGVLLAGCSTSSVPVSPRTSGPDVTQSPAAQVPAQSPTASPSPQKPGFLSQKRFTLGGSSMEPTLHDGDKLVGYPVYRDLLRGDIVVFSSPDSAKRTIVSRIVGLPGETIEVKDRQVLINGTVLAEPYIAEPPGFSVSQTTIPEKSYFIMSDNRNKSMGSQGFGPVPLANIQSIIEPP